MEERYKQALKVLRKSLREQKINRITYLENVKVLNEAFAKPKSEIELMTF